ncbi:MAG: hypothetical protein IJW55_09970 [Clostridia bacterium]|nr:hypothetical protein [Clostridia bacterium]MBQ7348273.1 hypothetical protein [Clostridia bacterium]
MTRRGLYRIICIALIAAMLAVCFSGCNDQQNNEETVGTELSTDSSDLAETVLTIVDNGQSEYNIYYDKSYASNDDFISVVGAMSKMIYNGTGARLSMTTDRYYKDTMANQPAILIGVTQWAESQEIAAKLTKLNDYYIGVVGNKLVICAQNAETSTTAVQYFMNNVLLSQTQNGKSITFSSKDNHLQKAVYGIDSVSLLGAELSEYRMVIPEHADVNENYFAYQLRYWLMKHYGVLLDIVNDSATAGERDILIGDTARSTSHADEDEYIVKASGKTLELSANGYSAYDELYQYVTKTLIPSKSGACYTIAETETTVNAISGFEERTASSITASGDVRVMYYNIYGWENYSTSVRKEMQLELFKTYSPDVIGLQEFSSSVRLGGLISDLSQLGYAEVKPKNAYSNFTPLFYKTDVLEVVESGYQLYSGLNDVNSKSVTWAVFSVKQTGERFIAMSTHFYWESTEEGAAARISNATELIDLIASIRANAEYAELPLVAGGDLNCTVSSEPANILSMGGLQFAWDLAVQKNDVSTHHQHAEYSADYQTYINLYRPTGKYSAAIDQVWVSSDNMTVNRLSTLTATYTMIASDHCPVLVDISF